MLLWEAICHRIPLILRKRTVRIYIANLYSPVVMPDSKCLSVLDDSKAKNVVYSAQHWTTWEPIQFLTHLQISMKQSSLENLTNTKVEVEDGSIRVKRELNPFPDVPNSEVSTLPHISKQAIFAHWLPSNSIERLVNQTPFWPWGTVGLTSKSWLTCPQEDKNQFIPPIKKYLTRIEKCWNK